VATNSKKNLWIVDDSKLVNTLGKFPLPVEVVPFGCEHLFEKFKEKGYRPEYRKDEEGAKFITDSDHFIIDLYLEKIDRKSTRLNSSHVSISYAVFCLKKKNQYTNIHKH